MIVAEANYLVNFQPLFSKNVDDLDEEPITGNSLLFPYKQCSIPQSSNNKLIDARLYAKAAQAFMNQFWESWLRNTPSHLLFRSKWFRPRQNLEVGDYLIVLKPGLKGQTAPRGLWEHAIVTEVFPAMMGLFEKLN